MYRCAARAPAHFDEANSQSISFFNRAQDGKRSAGGIAPDIPRRSLENGVDRGTVQELGGAFQAWLKLESQFSPMRFGGQRLTNLQPISKTLRLRLAFQVHLTAFPPLT